MYTVGQMARVCNVSCKLLRHYDELELFRPARVGPENQYRYYDREQIPVLRRILFLRDLGLGLELIRELVKSGALTDSDRLAAILLERADEVSREIAAREELLGRIQRSILMLKERGVAAAIAEPPVTIKTVPGVIAVGVRRTIPIRDAGALIAEAARRIRTQPVGPPFCLYYEQDFDPEAVDVEALFPVAGMGDRTLTAAMVASLTHLGPYETIGQSYSALFEWLNQQGHSLAGPIREIYLLGPERGKPAEEFVTEIQAPVRPAG